MKELNVALDMLVCCHVLFPLPIGYGLAVDDTSFSYLVQLPHIELIWNHRRIPQCRIAQAGASCRYAHGVEELRSNPITGEAASTLGFMGRREYSEWTSQVCLELTLTSLRLAVLLVAGRDTGSISVAKLSRGRNPFVVYIRMRS